MYAARDGHTTCVQYLLNAGADKDKENANRFKALTYASARGHSEVMQLLAGVSNSEPEEERESLFVDIAAKSTAPFPVSSVNDTLRRSQEYVVKNTFINTRSPVSEYATRRSSSLPSSSNASASAEAPKKRPRPSGEVQVVLRFGTDLGGVLSKFQNDVAMSCVLCNQSRKTRLNDYDISKVQLKLNNQSCDFFTDFKFI